MHILHLQILLFFYGPLSQRNCCHKPLLISELREQKCMMKYGPRSSSAHMINARCYYNCTTNGINLADDENHLSQEKISKYVEELFDDESYPDWKPIIEISIQTCFDKIEFWKSQKHSSVWSRLWAHHNSSHNDVTDSQSDCDPSAGVLLACLDSELIHHCPKGQWDASPNCQALLEHSMKKCGDGQKVTEPEQPNNAESVGI